MTNEPNPPPSPPQAAARHHLRSLDDTIEYCIGNLGWRQFLQSIILSFAWFFDAQQTFISVFTDAEPKWSCKNSTNNHSSCNSTSNICHLPKDSWSWELPARASTISEWSLQCSGPLITGLPASSFFLGCLAGALFVSTLADSYLGRKKMLILCCLVMSVPGAIAAFSINRWMHSGLRFLSGFGRATIGTNALVHASELVGQKYRDKIGAIGFSCFTLGFLSLPIIALLLRGYSWRLIYLCTCVPCIFYSVLLYFSVDESPRWLFVKGRKQEFAKTLTSLATPENRSYLTESFFHNCTKWAPEKSSEEQKTMFSALKMLLKKRWACQRLVVVMVVGFGQSLTYYGMPFGLGNLPFNLYLSVTLSALSELPASLITFFMIGKLKRKVSVLVLSLLSGTCSVVSVFVGLRGMQLALEMASFFGACTMCDVFLIYVFELFPTCVRNSAMSMVREASLLGGVLGPVMVAVGRKNGMLSYGLFGGAIAVCGVLVLLLPETKGAMLRDTMEEEEGKDGEVVNDGLNCA